MNNAGSKREDRMNRMDRITVIGAGVSGRALAILASKLGYSVFVSELASVDTETRELFHRYGIVHESDGHSERILECDAMVLSSGVSPRARPVTRALEEGVAIIGCVDERRQRKFTAAACLRNTHRARRSACFCPSTGSGSHDKAEVWHPATLCSLSSQ